jgi:hypothetical protein
MINYWHLKETKDKRQKLHIIWTRYFIEEQGYKLDESVLTQYTMSSMLLETNGKESSSKRKKHIKVRYFYKRQN